MPRLKLTKTVVETAQPEKDPYELRDAAIPGFLLKVTPIGRKVFRVAYVANNGQRRKPAIGRFGEITVEQARAIAQDWLADVRKGKDPSAEKSAERQAPTVKELFERLIADYSQSRNKPSTVEANLGYGRLYIVPPSRPDQGRRRHARGYLEPDEENGENPDECEPGPFGSPQDVQHGGGLGPAPGRIEPMPPHSETPGTRKDSADHRCRVEAVVCLFEQGGGRRP